MPHYSKNSRRIFNEAKARASEMRNNPTPAEGAMYRILYTNVVPKFPAHTFKSQWNIFAEHRNYILDFYCPTLNLAIEVDGSIHDNRQRYDEIEMIG